jgi:hypothetical protein
MVVKIIFTTIMLQQSGVYILENIPSSPQQYVGWLCPRGEQIWKAGREKGGNGKKKTERGKMEILDDRIKYTPESRTSCIWEGGRVFWAIHRPLKRIAWQIILLNTRASLLAGPQPLESHSWSSHLPGL